jgi:plastocyanin
VGSKLPPVLVTIAFLLFAACSPSASSTATPTAAAATATPATQTAAPSEAATETPEASETTAASECTDGATGTQTVTIAGFAFAPATLSLPAGTTVTWTNQDPTTHTATADDGAAFDCDPVGAGASMSFTFATPGTFAYHCKIHPTMTGTITVT